MTRSCGVWSFGLLWLCFQPQLIAAEPPSPATQPFQADTISRIVEQVEPSVVSILRVRHRPEDSRLDSFELIRTPRPPEDRELLPNDYGAGVLVKSDDSEKLFVLTAYHLVRGGRAVGQPVAPDQSELQLRFHHQRSCTAEIFAADPRSDLAVLTFSPKEVDGDPADLRPLAWRSSPPVRKGEIVVCLGNPYALARDGSASVSWGIVSNLARRPVFAANADLPSRRNPDHQSLQNLGTVLQIDARLQLGGSGGPVVNLQGQLVGLSTALAAIEGYEKSSGFAIPVAPPMRRVIDTLLLGQEVEYGLLGISPANVTTEEMRQRKLYHLQPSAVEVRGIPEGSPAIQAGILRSDVLLKINDRPVLSSADLMRIVGELPPETEVAVQLYRSESPNRGEVLTRRSKLGKWPVKDDEGIIATQPKYPSWRGLRVDYSSAREKFVNLEPRFLPGVIVVEIAPSSRAAEARLQQGDVITHVQKIPVQTPEQFQRAVKSLQGDVILKLFAEKPGDRTSVSLSE